MAPGDRPEPRSSELVADAAPHGTGLPSAAAETPALDPPPAAVAPTAGLPRIEWEQSAGPSSQSRPRRAGAFGPSAAAGGSRETNARSEQTVLAALDQRVASVVRMAVDGRQGSGLYVKPRLLVTTGELVGSASMVEMTTSDGEEVLGLVVHVDPARNLALVHVPRSGRSAPVAAAPAVGPGQTIELVELVGGGRARVLRAVLRAASQGGDRIANALPALHLELGEAGAPGTSGAPLFLDEQAIGLIANQDSGRLRNIIRLDHLDDLLALEALAALQ
jgi:S1-C subfamily serine protease